MTSFSEDDIKNKTLQLPSDWWQTYNASSTLVQWFKKHIVPLLVAGYVGGEFQFSVSTGLLLNHNNTIIWLTAGHVIDELLKILESSDFKLSKMAWLDNYEVSNVENVPLHRTNILMKSWHNEGLDVGVLKPSILDVGTILKNKNNVKPIDAQIWKILSQAKVEGYYAIGYPRPLSNHSKSLPLIIKFYIQ